MHAYVYCSIIHNSKDLEPINDTLDKENAHQCTLDKEMWHIYDMKYYTAIKRMSSCPLQGHG